MQYKIRWQYQIPEVKEVMFESEWLSRSLITDLLLDIEKTGRMKDVIIIDEMEQTWTKKEFQKQKKILDQSPSDITIYFDGNFDLDKRMGGIGNIIYYRKENEMFRVRRNSQIQEMETSGEVEYAALFQGITLLEEMKITHLPVTIKGDARGVIMQLLGEWPCYDNVLNRWLDHIEEKIKKLSIKPKYEYTTRKENKEAHKLAHQALDGILIDSCKKIDPSRVMRG